MLRGVQNVQPYKNPSAQLLMGAGRTRIAAVNCLRHHRWSDGGENWHRRSDYQSYSSQAKNAKATLADWLVK
jgi:hypothetical protein